MKKKKNKRKIDKKFKIALLFFLIAAILISGFNAYMIIKSANEYNKGTDTYDEIRELAVRKDISPMEKDRIDFDALKSVNDDMIGWLTLEDTVIDYPVVKGKDNEYYLNHLYTGEWNSLGTLFIDHRNGDLFNDQISVIYGHSMLNGSMFFILERYKNQSFYEEHKQFIFETPDKTYLLKPLAGKVMDAKIPFLQFNFDTVGEYEEYVNDYIRTSTFISEESFTRKDRVVMMIKCSADYEDARYVLLCKVEEKS